MPGSTNREHWRLDGYDLRGTSSDGSVINVKITPVAGSVAGRKNIVEVDLNGGSQSFQNPSKKAPVREFRFSIRKSQSTGDLHAVLRDIVDFLENNDVLYLHAPSLTQSARAYLDERLVWIIPESWSEEDEQGGGSIGIRFSARILGIPEAYGGTARSPYHGTFTKSAGGFTNDNGVETVGPYLELPEQRSGWPKAIRQSDKALVAVSTTVGSPRVEYQPGYEHSGVRNWVTYDLTGFLHPTPSVNGDVGVYQIYSNPVQGWFEWTSPIAASALGGIGSQSVGSFSVGSA